MARCGSACEIELREALARSGSRKNDHGAIVLIVDTIEDDGAVQVGFPIRSRAKKRRRSCHRPRGLPHLLISGRSKNNESTTKRHGWQRGLSTAERRPATRLRRLTSRDAAGIPPSLTRNLGARFGFDALPILTAAARALASLEMAAPLAAFAQAAPSTPPASAATATPAGPEAPWPRTVQSAATTGRSTTPSSPTRRLSFSIRWLPTVERKNRLKSTSTVMATGTLIF